MNQKGIPMKTTTENPQTQLDYSGKSPNAVDETGGSFLSHLWASIASMILLLIICCGAYPLLVWGIAQAVFPHQANGSLVKKDGTSAVKDADVVGSSLLGQTFSAPAYFHPRPSAANNGAGNSYSVTGGYDPTSSGGTNYGPLSDELINGATTSPTAPATQPAEFLAYDGIRLRTIHYANDNAIAFKLYHATYTTQDDGTITLDRKEEVPLKTFQDAQGNLNDIALVDAFPHPTSSDEYKRTVLIAGDFATPIPGDAVTASASGLDPHISPANAKLQAQRVADARHIGVDKVLALVDQKTDQPSLGFLGDPGVNVLMLNLALDAAYPVPVAQAPATQPAK
jgi:K+-transporting ATPase ATPase C chain